VAKLERKPAERVAVAGVIVQALSGVLAFVFCWLSQSASAWVLTWQILIGVLVWVVCLMQLRQMRLAEEETEEWERLQAERAAGGARGQLFEEDEIQAFSARNRLRILEKYVAPILSLVLAGFLALVVIVAVWPVKVADESAFRLTLMSINPARALISFASVITMTFILFLIAMYARGMSRQKEWRALRPGSSYMMFSTLVSVGAAASLALGAFKVMAPDRIIAFVILGLMAIVSVEIVLNFILDFYRPRLEEVESRPAYDSRLLALIAEPGGILRTVATTLDYQFGFKVSQTWFYRFVEQAIAPLILFQILTLYLLTSFVIVGPDQQGIVERFGKCNRITGPGLCWKWPWPIESIHRLSANQVKTFVIGHKGEAKTDRGFLWTVKHYEEEHNVLVATERTGDQQEVPVNLLVAAATVRYRIRDGEENLKKWYYGFSQPEKLIESLCTREQTKYLAKIDFFDVMGAGRMKAAQDLRDLMQTVTDSVPGKETIGMGVEILSVGLEGIHPPVVEGLPDAFHRLVEAVEAKEVLVLRARTAAIRTEMKAAGEGDSLKLAAEAYYAGRVALEKAKAWRFGVQSKAYRNTEDIFKLRTYMAVLEEALSRTRNYVVGMKGLDRQHIRLNLEDPSGLDITDIGEFEKPMVSESAPIE